MNVLSRDKQIEVIAALCEGVGIRTASPLTGVNRGTVANLALRVGMGCMELHDRLMVGIRTERLELDEMWSFVGKKQKNVQRHEINAKGDQYVFIGMAGTQKAIISWGVGKRNAESTMDFLHDLRSRVIGRFTRLTNGFSKKLDNHVAAVALYVAHYNLCRTHEALRTTPAKALGLADKAWSIAACGCRTLCGPCAAHRDASGSSPEVHRNSGRESGLALLIRRLVREQRWERRAARILLYRLKDWLIVATSKFSIVGDTNSFCNFTEGVIVPGNILL